MKLSVVREMLGLCGIWLLVWLGHASGLLAGARIGDTVERLSSAPTIIGLLLFAGLVTLAIAHRMHAQTQAAELGVGCLLGGLGLGIAGAFDGLLGCMLISLAIPPIRHAWRKDPALEPFHRR